MKEFLSGMAAIGFALLFCTSVAVVVVRLFPAPPVGVRPADILNVLTIEKGHRLECVVKNVDRP